MIKALTNLISFLERQNDQREMSLMKKKQIEIILLAANDTSRRVASIFNAAYRTFKRVPPMNAKKHDMRTR